MMYKKIEGDAPKQSYRLLRKFLPKRLQPFARGLRKWLSGHGLRVEKPYCWTYTFTQVSKYRQESILDKTEQLVRDGIEGDFVECGVLDGGTAALMAYSARSDDRRLHLFDAWSGMPETVEKDGSGSDAWVGENVGSPKRVRRVLKKVGASMNNVEIHKGWFNDTIPASSIEKIAFLHIDCDFYEPTCLVLNSFVPKMVKGGWVQIDDYTSFEGCRLAVNEFIEQHSDIQLTVEGRPGGAIYFQM